VILVSRTQAWQPSKLGLLADCPLRYVLETERSDVPRLPAGPATLLGTIAHRIVAEHSRAGSPATPELRASILSQFEGLARREHRSLLGWLVTYRPLPRVLGPALLNEQCRRIKQRLRLARSGEGEWESPRSSGRGTMRGVFGVERPLSDEELGISGRLDAVWSSGDGEVCVHEYKTGRIRGGEAELRPAYRAQILAYGVLAKRAFRLRQVRLMVSGADGLWERLLSSSMEDEVMELLRRANEALPLGVSRQAETLAVMGGHCARCQVRAGCPSYMSLLASDERDESTEALAKGDFYGEVRGGQEAQGLSTLHLLAPNRTAQVTGVPIQLVDDLSGKRPLSVFGLRSAEVKPRGRSISNFFVTHPSDVSGSAFQFLTVCQ
jgi:hypothetical protein